MQRSMPLSFEEAFLANEAVEACEAPLVDARIEVRSSALGAGLHLLQDEYGAADCKAECARRESQASVQAGEHVCDELLNLNDPFVLRNLELRLPPPVYPVEHG